MAGLPCTIRVKAGSAPAGAVSIAKTLGWAIVRVADGYSENEVEFFAWKGGTSTDPEYETGWCSNENEAAEEALCIDRQIRRLAEV